MGVWSQDFTHKSNVTTTYPMSPWRLQAIIVGSRWKFDIQILNKINEGNCYLYVVMETMFNTIYYKADWQYGHYMTKVIKCTWYLFTSRSFNCDLSFLFFFSFFLPNMCFFNLKNAINKLVIFRGCCFWHCVPKLELDNINP